MRWNGGTTAPLVPSFPPFPPPRGNTPGGGIIPSLAQSQTQPSAGAAPRCDGTGEPRLRPSRSFIRSRPPLGTRTEEASMPGQDKNKQRQQGKQDRQQQQQQQSDRQRQQGGGSDRGRQQQ